MAAAKHPRRAGTTLQGRVIRQLEEALAELEPRQHGHDTMRARADSVVSTLADVKCAILIANNWGRFVHMNNRAVRLTGYSAAELRRRSVWDLTPDVDLATARQTWRAFLKNGRMRGPFAIQRKDGRAMPVGYVAIANVLPGLHVSALLPRRRPRAR
jgi:PAS domain S-box-containing protein